MLLLTTVLCLLIHLYEYRVQEVRVKCANILYGYVLEQSTEQESVMSLEEIMDGKDSVVDF